MNIRRQTQLLPNRLTSILRKVFNQTDKIIHTVIYSETLLTRFRLRRDSDDLRLDGADVLTHGPGCNQAPLGPEIRRTLPKEKKRSIFLKQKTAIFETKDRYL